MNEVEWLECTEAEVMLEFFGIFDHKRSSLIAWWRLPQRKYFSQRKLGLFACACCRRVMRFNREISCQNLIDICEQYADALLSAEELRVAREAIPDCQEIVIGSEEALQNSIRSMAHHLGSWNRSDVFLAVAYAAAITAGESAIKDTMKLKTSQDAEGANVEEVWQRVKDVSHTEEKKVQCMLLRDIAGNPFHPIAIDPTWLSRSNGIISQLAQASYVERQQPEGILDNTRLTVLADALEEAGCSEADLLLHLRSGVDHVRGCWAVDLLLDKQ